jgi:outer membrane protein assembly factor BamD (BamD/ComL family)
MHGQDSFRGLGIMIFRDLPSKWLASLLAVFSFTVLGIGFWPPTAAYGQKGGGEAKSLSAAALWQAAEEAVAVGNQKKAVRLLGRLRRSYPEAEQAEEALWQEARLRHELARGRKEADWGKVRDLYHQYVTEYPKGVHFEEAYLDLGLAHYRMHFFPEALVYLKLFLGRFPQSRYRDKARYWQGRTLLKIGRPDQAEPIFQKLAAGKDSPLRVKAKEALGDLCFTTGRYQEALATYQDSLQEFAPDTEEHFEIIRKLGLTHARLGHEVACRDDLYQYLNVVPDSSHEAEVLFELGESYWRTGDTGAARVLYERALHKARPGKRAAVLSRFRLVLIKGFRKKNHQPWQKQDDLGDEDDAPYQAVLESFGREPIAQDARYALLQRLTARKESKKALLLAKAYLNSSGGEEGQRRKVASMLYQLLEGRVQSLLQAKKYQQVCDLYQKEYHYFDTDQDERLLYLLGQAFQELGLYDQASRIYYRALNGKLTTEEKSDLYERRAQVYLAKGDLKAARRLLAYLRDFYAGKKGIDKFLYLTGRLREAQGKARQAASFYAKACDAEATGEGGASCLAEMRLRLQLDQVGKAAAALARSRKKNLLRPADLQQGYGALGDAWRRKGELARAVTAYAEAVGEKMPQDGEKAQSVHLRLADLYLKLGQVEKGSAHYEKASSGPDPLLAKSAEEGLRLAGIEQGAAKLLSLSPQAEGKP